MRWAIYEFAVIQDNNKKKEFDKVMQQLKYKTIFSTQVVPRLVKGTRLVAQDGYGSCNNCYHYGPWPVAGSIKGKCMNHVYDSDSGDHWMTFKEFVSRSRNNFHYSTYEEYEIECKIKFRKQEAQEKKMEEEAEKIMVAEAERVIQEYYSSEWNQPGRDFGDY
jgi:hypothetical protein